MNFDPSAQTVHPRREIYPVLKQHQLNEIHHLHFRIGLVDESGLIVRQLHNLAIDTLF